MWSVGEVRVNIDHSFNSATGISMDNFGEKKHINHDKIFLGNQGLLFPWWGQAGTYHTEFLPTA